MKFTSDDRVALLKCYGAKDGDKASTDEAVKQLALDMRQLEEAADVTIYELCDADGIHVIQRVSRETAISLLGREVWLSGLVRSAFHWNAARQTADGKNYVMFNSRALFK